MQNRTIVHGGFANRLLWSLVDQGYSINFEPNNGVITCVISKDKQEASGESNNVSSALYIAWRIFREQVCKKQPTPSAYGAPELTDAPEGLRRMSKGAGEH